MKFRLTEDFAQYFLTCIFCVKSVTHGQRVTYFTPNQGESSQNYKILTRSQMVL